MSQRRTALVIDDDADSRRRFRHLLELAGFTVDTCNGGLDAVELRKRYEVILLDLEMPVCDGATVTKYWMVSDRDILKRVILVADDATRPEARSSPVFATVPKTTADDAMLHLVLRCVGQAAGERSSAR